MKIYIFLCWLLSRKFYTSATVLGCGGTRGGDGGSEWPAIFYFFLHMAIMHKSASPLQEIEEWQVWQKELDFATGCSLRSEGLLKGSFPIQCKKPSIFG